ncbi:MAG TPA: hypothetical protein VGO93_10725 [Candidatus Xenobia bacterium]|jgi:hypothetical protein
MGDELDRNLDAAAQASQWRQMAAKGQSWKHKWRASAVGTDIQTGDELEMVGVTSVALRKGDLVCYQRGLNIAAGRILSQASSEGRNALTLDVGGGKEENVLQVHVVGKVVNINRGSQRVVLDKARERKRLAEGQPSPVVLIQNAVQNMVDTVTLWLERRKK